MTSVSLMSWLQPCLTCARFHSCACMSSQLQMLFKFHFSFRGVCEKLQVKKSKSTMMFSGCAALKHSCSLLLDGQVGMKLLKMVLRYYNAKKNVGFYF